MGIFKGKRPDVTPAQVLAVLTWIVTQAVAYGYISDERSQLVLSAAGTLIAVGWKLADAFLRGSRAQAQAMVDAAKIAGPSAPAQ